MSGLDRAHAQCQPGSGRPAAVPQGCPRAVLARVRGGGEAGFQMFFSDCQAANMAGPSGVSLRASPSWKGAHFGRGAGGPRPDLARRCLPGADPAGARAVQPALLPLAPPSPLWPPGRRPRRSPFLALRSPALGPHPRGAAASSRAARPPSHPPTRVLPPGPR